MTGFCVPPCGSSPPSPSILHLLPTFQEVGKEQPACGLALPRQRQQHLRLGASPITQNAKLCVTERRWSVNVLSLRSEVTVPYLISLMEVTASGRIPQLLKPCREGYPLVSGPILSVRLAV